MRRMLAPLIFCLASAGCGIFNVETHDGCRGECAGSDRFRARARTEQIVAVSKPGTRVCRSIAVGISENDWIMGQVAEVKNDRIGVKIADPGNFPHILNGTGIVRGAVIWDDATNWTPCIE